MANRKNELLWLNISPDPSSPTTSDYADYSQGVPQFADGVSILDETTGNAEGGISAAGLEQNGFMASLFDDDANLVKTMLDTVHKTEVLVQIQHGPLASGGTAGQATAANPIEYAKCLAIRPHPRAGGPTRDTGTYPLQWGVNGKLYSRTTNAITF